MKKLDVLILAVVLVVAAAAFFAIRLFGNEADNAGGYAEIYVKNELFETVSLDKDRLIEVENADAHNLLEVKDGSIRMIEASCHSQTCVHTGARSSGGQTIVCLPNRVVVKIVGAPSEEGVDIIAN